MSNDKFGRLVAFTEQMPEGVEFICICIVHDTEIVFLNHFCILVK